MAAQITEAHQRDDDAELAAQEAEHAPDWIHVRNVARARLHIIMPVLNEEAALRVLLQDLTATQRAATIMVDNGSTDASAALARNAGVRVVSEPRRGYGTACLAGLAALGAAAAEDIVLFLDGDASDDVADIPAVVAPIERHAADLVIGSRTLGRRERGALTPHARFGNWLATRWIHYKTGVRYSDLGPLRALRMGTLRNLRMQDRDYGWTVEMQLKAAQQQLRIHEVPVRYRRRIGRSKISGTVRGSLRAGWVILQTIQRHGR